MKAERFYLKLTWYNEFSYVQKYDNLLVHLRQINYTDTCLILYKNQLILCLFFSVA